MDVGSSTETSSGSQSYVCSTRYPPSHEQVEVDDVSGGDVLQSPEEASRCPAMPAFPSVPACRSSMRPTDDPGCDRRRRAALAPRVQSSGLSTASGAGAGCLIPPARASTPHGSTTATVRRSGRRCLDLARGEADRIPWRVRVAFPDMERISNTAKRQGRAAKVILSATVRSRRRTIAMAVNGKSLNRAGADNARERPDSLVFFDEWDLECRGAGAPLARSDGGRSEISEMTPPANSIGRPSCFDSSGKSQDLLRSARAAEFQELPTIGVVGDR